MPLQRFLQGEPLQQEMMIEARDVMLRGRGSHGRSAGGRTDLPAHSATLPLSTPSTGVRRAKNSPRKSANGGASSSAGKVATTS